MFGSIYGPGVLNDTIVPGYGVTKFPVNLHTFWSLPNGTTRNFGEATQYVTYPQGYPSIMYQLARNFTDPNHISQWNPMLIGFNLGATNSTTDPALINMGNQMAYQWGQNIAAQMQIEQAVQNIAQAINSMESRLTALLSSDKLTAAQKAQIQGLIDQIKAKKEEISKKLQEGQPSMDDVSAMQQEVIEIQKKVSETASKISEQLNGSQTPSNDNDGGSSSTTDPDLAGTDYENIDPKTGKPTSLTNPADGEAEEFCARIDRALKGAGTDEDALRETLPGITANNVIEIVNQWKDTRRGNLFGELLDDLNDGEQKEMIPILVKALTDRASALGIYDEIKVEISKINQELAAERNCINWIWGAGQNDSVIEANLLAICEKIEAKETENKDGAKKASDKQKAENKDKAEKRKQEVITEKKVEFANQMKSELKLDKVPELSSAVKINTDDDGEFTDYSIKLNTPNGVVTLKGATYHQLALEIEKYGLEPKDCFIKKQVKA